MDVLLRTLRNGTPCVSNAEIGRLLPTRTGRRRDREAVRKQVIRPLLERGILEKVTRQRDGTFVPGHPIPRSPRCCYRLTGTGTHVNPVPVVAWSHERLVDACAACWETWGYVVVYRDPADGPRVTAQSLHCLRSIGLDVNVHRDPIPDLVLWNVGTKTLCVVEAVMTEGAIDDRRQRQLDAWLGRFGRRAELVTAFPTWKKAARFMDTLSLRSDVWVPSQLWRRDDGAAWQNKILFD